GFQRLLKFLLRFAFILYRQRRLAEKLMDTIGVGCNRKKSFILPVRKFPRNEGYVVQRVYVLRIGCQNFLKSLECLLEFPQRKLRPRQNQSNRNIFWVSPKMFFRKFSGPQVIAAIKRFGA